MKTRILSAIACAMAWLVAPFAQAANLTWDANNTGANQTDGAGAWLGANQWWNGSANATWTSGDDAIFGKGGAGGAVTNTSPTTVNSLTFNSFSGTYTLGLAGQTITLTNGITMNAGAGAVTIISPVALGADQTWQNKTANNLQIGGGSTTLDNKGYLLTFQNGKFQIPANTDVFQGAGGTTLDNATLNLYGGGTQPNFNNLTGPITIKNGGIFRWQGGNFGAGTGMGNITIEASGGYIESYYGANNVTRSLGADAGKIQLLGGASGFSEQGNSSTVTLNNSAAFEVVWGTANEAGNALATGFFNPSTLLLQADTVNSGKTITFANKVDLNATTRTIRAGKDLSSFATMSGVIRNSSGTAGIIKTGPGHLIFSANNSYNGSTTINQGMVDFGAITLGFGSGRDIAVAAGAGVKRNTLDNAFLNRIVETSDEFSLVGISGANNLNLSSSTGANLPKAFIGHRSGNGGKVEYTGTITPASDNYRLGTPIWMSGLMGIRNESAMTGTQGLIVGGGSVELVGPKTFTGDTVIRNGARLGLAAISGGGDAAFCLQNSVLDTGTPASTGTFWLESVAGPDAKITGAQYTSSAVLGGLKGSRNLASVHSTTTGANNGKATAVASITGFTLNVSADKTNTYSGVIGGFGVGASGANGGSMTLTKTGAGTQIFSGKITYTNSTIIGAGTFALGAHNVLTNIAPVTIVNGTLDMQTYTNNVGTLTVAGSTGRINLGSGAKLVFADSSSVTWSGSKLLVAGDFVQASSIRFGTSSSTLTPEQLAKITFVGGGYAKLDDNGFLKSYRGMVIRIN